MILCLLFYTRYSINAVEDYIYKKYQDIQKNIQENYESVLDIADMKNDWWHPSYEKFYRANLDGKFQEYIGDEPIYVFEIVVDASLHQFGNRIGFFFEALSFCKKYHLHFIAFFPHNISAPINDPLEKKIMDALYSLPTLILHESPVTDYQQELQTLKQLPFINGYSYLIPEGYIWENIGEVMNILQKFSESIGNILNTNRLPIDSFDAVIDSANLNEDSKLPLIPDAVIILRCNDLFNIGASGYGLYSFNLFTMIIPAEVQSIYINTEDSKYSYTTPVQPEICKIISDELMKFLSQKFPSATVAVRRGYALESYYQLSISNIAICHPSTFCIWPAFANHHRKGMYLYHANLPFGKVPLPKHIYPIYYPNLFLLSMKETIDENANKTDIAYRMVEYLKSDKPRKRDNPQQFFENFPAN